MNIILFEQVVIMALNAIANDLIRREATDMESSHVKEEPEIRDLKQSPGIPRTPKNWKGRGKFSAKAFGSRVALATS